MSIFDSLKRSLADEVQLRAMKHTMIEHASEYQKQINKLNDIIHEQDIKIRQMTEWSDGQHKEIMRLKKLLKDNGQIVEEHHHHNTTVIQHHSSDDDEGCLVGDSLGAF